MSVVFFLIKFFDNEDHGRDFVSGRIYANTLAKFKRLEDVDDSGRGDRNEGTIAFRKQDRHSYQREFRFVIDKGLVSASPLILEIGDITDITRRFDFAELNGEEFLGGEMAVPE